MKPNLSWSYRIQGVAEAPADPTLHTFMAPLAPEFGPFFCTGLSGKRTWDR